MAHEISILTHLGNVESVRLRFMTRDPRLIPRAAIKEEPRVFSSQPKPNADRIELHCVEMRGLFDFLQEDFDIAGVWATPNAESEQRDGTDVAKHSVRFELARKDISAGRGVGFKHVRPFMQGPLQYVRIRVHPPMDTPTVSVFGFGRLRSSSLRLVVGDTGLLSCETNIRILHAKN